MLMKWLWQLVGDYGFAIILFTLATKLVLLPVSVWIHKNSIQMVKIQPDINMIKVKYYGDSDTIADEQAKLFKKVAWGSGLAGVIIGGILIYFFGQYM